MFSLNWKLGLPPGHFELITLGKELEKVVMVLAGVDWL